MNAFGALLKDFCVENDFDYALLAQDKFTTLVVHISHLLR